MEFKLDKIIFEQVKEYDPKETRSVNSAIKTENPISSAAAQGPKTPPVHTCRESVHWAPMTPQQTRFPLGKPMEMLPADIVDPVRQLAAVGKINGNWAQDRIITFRRDDGSIKALIAHFESVWYSFWWAPAGSDYLFGTTVMIKHSASTEQKLFNLFPGTQRRSYRLMTSNYSSTDGEGYGFEDFAQCKIGKAKWLRLDLRITADTLANGFSWSPWTQPHARFLSCQAGNKLGPYRAIEKEIDAWFVKNPVFKTWVDEGLKMSMTRLSNNHNTLWYCFTQAKRVYISGSSSYNTTPLLKPDVITFEWFEHTAKWWTEYYKMLPDTGRIPKDFFEKPSVQRLLRRSIEESQKLYDLAQGDDPKHWYKFPIGAPMLSFNYWLAWCDRIYSIWRKCPIDHLVNNYDMLLQLTPYVMDYAIHNLTRTWLYENMPVESFFKLLQQQFAKEDLKYTTRSATEPNIKPIRDKYRHDIIIYHLSDLQDTFASIKDVLQAGNQVSKPNRWRLTEWHDHSVAELWKTKNKDFDMPQDLFPQPVTIKLNNIRYTLIQPMSAHQLAQWGKAARNCVGSTSYASGVQQRKHMILMIMCDQKPRYTVQLKLDGGILRVYQIKDVGNRTLSTVEKDEVERVFKQALYRREKELKDSIPDKTILVERLQKIYNSTS